VTPSRSLISVDLRERDDYPRSCFNDVITGLTQVSRMLTLLLQAHTGRQIHVRLRMIYISPSVHFAHFGYHESMRDFPKKFTRLARAWVIHPRDQYAVLS
jgi:hypothetical protein